ncbi:hypothetical protein ACFL2Q_19950 [Thermodesulfobacteriota bacterium]
MPVLKPFEIEVLKILAARELSFDLIEELAENGEIIAYDTTGNGYYLTIRVRSLDKPRTVCAKPLIFGENGGIETSFVVFMEGNELTLECHGWGDKEIPRDYREQDIAVRAT